MNHTLSLERWVVKPRPNPAATLRLFCFPYAGGGTQMFREWSRILPTAVEVCTMELPGRGTRLTEPIFSRLSPLVEAIVQSVEQHLGAWEKEFDGYVNP